jgi:hypothetical protein
MKRVNTWLLSAAAALVVVGLVVPIGKWRQQSASGELHGTAATDAVEVCEGFPWRDPNSCDERIMHVVVENEGAYIETQCVPYEVFRTFMIKHAKTWRPDHVLISGSSDCRIGHGVEVLDTLRLLQLSPAFATNPIPSGTRLPAIEIWKDGQPPEFGEEETPR